MAYVLLSVLALVSIALFQIVSIIILAENGIGTFYDIIFAMAIIGNAISAFIFVKLNKLIDDGIDCHYEYTPVEEKKPILLMNHDENKAIGLWKEGPIQIDLEEINPKTGKPYLVPKTVREKVRQAALVREQNKRIAKTAELSKQRKARKAKKA